MFPDVAGIIFVCCASKFKSTNSMCLLEWAFDGKFVFVEWLSLKVAEFTLEST